MRVLQSRCEDLAEKDAGNSVSHVQSVGQLAYDQRNTSHYKCAEFNILSISEVADPAL